LGANAQAAVDQCAEQRIYERITTALVGNLFVPSEETLLECRVVNLSGGGASVHCSLAPPEDMFVILHIAGFGRFEGVVVRRAQGEVALKFLCKEAKRQRLLADIVVYVYEGEAALKIMRRHERTYLDTAGYLIRSTGETVPCDLLDISLQGISLKTNTRPPIGEIVNVGCSSGRVVRHHQEGIAIQFLEVGPSRLRNDLRS
jgi:hypothetical protein